MNFTVNQCCYFDQQPKSVDEWLVLVDEIFFSCVNNYCF